MSPISVQPPASMASHIPVMPFGRCHDFVPQRGAIKQALSHMRTDDTHDELLTEALRVRRLASGARFVFERAGSALTVLSIADTQNSRT